MSEDKREVKLVVDASELMTATKHLTATADRLIAIFDGWKENEVQVRNLSERLSARNREIEMMRGKILSLQKQLRKMKK